MLISLYVKNLALIEEAEVSFGPGLNILTGETGAGKSILLGSVNLALGQKFTKEMLRNPEDSALVELVFQAETADAAQKLRMLEIEPEDGQIIFTRKIKNGRSINRINGEACTVSQLKKAAADLLDIHGQHTHQSLLYPDQQLAIIDNYGKEQIDALRLETSEAYSAYRQIQRELEGYQSDSQERERERAFLEYEIREIDEAALSEGEEEELEKQYRRMVNSRKIAEGLGLVYQLTGAGDGAGEQISRALREVTALAEYDEAIEELAKTLADTESVLMDFNHAVSAYLSEFSFSEEAFRETEQRLDLIHHLQSKYGKTIHDVLDYREKQAERLDTLEHFAQRKAALEESLEKQEATLAAVTGRLTAARRESAQALTEAIRKELAELNFLSNAFEITFRQSEQYGRNGRDEVTWMISTNPGEPLRPLANIASGGELSRVMLAIRTLMADRGGLETLIFDEIDAGISGRTAQLVSEKMARIARHHQIICITHLAQIAAMADSHFLIEKRVENGSTATHIRALDQEESIDELARILGGAEITGAARENAADMKRQAAQIWKTRRESDSDE